MGNYRFKLSDMMPNAWFYKLRDMGKTRNQKLNHPIKKPAATTTKTGSVTAPKERELSMHRNSYYYTRGEKIYASPVHPKTSDNNFPDPPRRRDKVRKNTARNSRSSKLVASSVSAGCSCSATLDSVWKPVSYDGSTGSLPEIIPTRNLREVLYATELHESNFSDSVESKSRDQFDKGSIGWSSSCSCRVSSSTTDIIIDMEKKPCGKFDGVESLQFSDSTPEVELTPILTKPPEFNDLILDMKKKKESEAKTQVNLRSRVGDGDRISHGSLSIKVLKKGSIKSFHEQSSPLKKSSLQTTSKSGSPVSQGVKMRANSPRLASKKIQAYNRKTTQMNAKSKSRISESFAIVKSSHDPHRDFRESMVEMIMDNNIRSSKDLEELLACYLSLNSNEYHDVIVKVFEQVWFDLTDICL